MFERAAICTDLTQSSASVVACAGALGDLGVREAVLVHVIDVRAAHLRSPAETDAFARQAELLEDAGIRVRIDAALGYPAYEIESVAESNRCDLIVIGSHRKGLFPAMFSGSTSSDVMRIASRPVLLVALEVLGSPEDSRLACSRLLSSVLFLTDLSPRSDLAARYLLALAHAGLRRADLLHVVPLGERAAPDRARIAGERIQALADELRMVGVETVVSVRHGSPAQVAAERVRGGGHSLVLVAPHERTPAASAIDSVTNAVIRNTAAPVLVIPPRCVREPSGQPAGIT
ncbi:MAG: universal stress protein [Coriobacteriia bacterium]|nr:universal stress protein [Coriobacteriia bacterium]